jgi:hypothetical protein
MDFSRQLDVRMVIREKGWSIHFVYRTLELKFENRQVPYLNGPEQGPRESSRWRHVHYSIAMECCDAAFHDSKDRVMCSDSRTCLIFPAILSVLFIVS